MSAARCPTCGRARTWAPADLVVRGLAGDRAPILSRTWATLVPLLTTEAAEPVERGRLVEAARIIDPRISPTTCEGLIGAARRAGLLRLSYRRTGKPRRRRAYVRWLDEPQ